MLKTLTALALAATLAACSTTSPDVITRSETGRMATVLSATVESVRDVTVQGGTGPIGAATGAVVLGTAGNSVGGKREQVAVGTLAAVLGGLIGHAIESHANREEAQEIVVRLANGERRAIVQAKAGESFRPGDPVTLVASGGRVRVTLDGRRGVTGS
jgi:outer membrane lipoprotein SlyB